MWIDSHCHLNHPGIADLGSPEDLIARAHESNVEGMLTISCRIVSEFPEILKIAQSHENVWCTVGTHPHDAGLEEERNVSLDQLVETANSDENIIGIGESGLDYYYDNSPRDDQAESFRKHIRACIETGLPLVVHARDADEDILKILKEEGAGTSPLKGVMHCFSSGRGLAEGALDLGFYISFSGIVTFKKSTELQDIAKDIPLDRILVETDAPFLAPQPFRGKVNEPALVTHTGQFLANLKNISEQDMATYSKENFFTLFDKAKLT